MTPKVLLARLRVDPYIMLIVGMVVLASLLPASGSGERAVSLLTTAAIALLFFLYGVRLPRETVVAGLTHWRLQALVFLLTFAVFPILGLGIRAATEGLLGPALSSGLLFLCLLPSTVQSSIAFTSIGRGNVAAAICAASFSNLVGVVLTPLLVGLFLSTTAGISADAVWGIALQLLLPFLAGQAVRPWVNPWVSRHRALTGYVDRGSILLVVYAAFSEGVNAGIWRQVDATTLAGLLAVNLALLAVVLTVSCLAARLLGFSKEDEIAIVFCGSKKSLASGLPMANILFAGQSVGLVVLPLLLFHQIQLMACAALARRYGARPEPADPIDTVGGGASAPAPAASSAERPL